MGLKSLFKKIKGEIKEETGVTEECLMEGMDPKEYFHDILMENFPQYEIAADVPVQDIARELTITAKLYESRPERVYKAEWGRPYTFAIKQGGQVRAVIMLDDGTKGKNVKLLISRKFAEDMGITYIHFITRFSNKKTYVVDRIKSLIG